MCRPALLGARLGVRRDRAGSDRRCGAWLAVPCALVTLWCTGMIYASLPTIRAWHQPLVAPIYIVLALATGGVLLSLLLARVRPRLRAGPPAASALPARARLAISRRATGAPSTATEQTYTAEAATGLGHLGKVRPLDPPHTQPNFVMREMGYQVARKHAEKLRRLASLLLFVVPLAAAAAAARCRMPAPLADRARRRCAVSATVGVLIERWLFFAEAEHVVMLYYRGGTA